MVCPLQGKYCCIWVCLNINAAFNLGCMYLATKKGAKRAVWKINVLHHFDLLILCDIGYNWSINEGIFKAPVEHSNVNFAPLWCRPKLRFAHYNSPVSFTDVNIDGLQYVVAPSSLRSPTSPPPHLCNSSWLFLHWLYQYLNNFPIKCLLPGQTTGGSICTMRL